jgi:hypothetical protein
MNSLEIRQYIQRNPKHMGDFTRDRQHNLERVITINFTLYTHKRGYLGASIGDGRIYGIRLQPTESRKIIVPDLEKIHWDGNSHDQ